ncbi:MAG: 23S rRNA (uracil(1939)-C(5))-methyltransferase, partial [Variovorax sp.]
HLEPLTLADRWRLQRFAEVHPGVQWWLQAKGPETARLLSTMTPAATADEVPGEEVGPAGDALMYHLPEFGIRMPFRPTDFTQVNPHINRVLVARVLRWLEVQPGDRVIDWFCGLGNFTLPLATVAGSVVGVEGSASLVTRARKNYQLNQPANAMRRALAPTRFEARNLFEATSEMLKADGPAERWLLDPPREGAVALVNALAALIEAAQPAENDWQAPSRVVYVSCNPATLARDADVLVHKAGYRCIGAGIVNMFPHTAHVESIAVFRRN